MRSPAERAIEDPAIALARSLVEVLRRRAERQGARTIFTFLPESGDAPSLTFADLDARARAIAARLLDEKLSGERALLLYPAGLGFVEAFFGCLYAGVIAVPAYPLRANRTLDRLAAMASDSGAAAALSPAAEIDRSREIAATSPALARVRFVVTDEPGGGSAGGAFDPAPEALAYLQYTSGSTAEPRGVMIGHANVVANSEAIRRGFGHSGESRGLSWLPHFHDMGLIDGIVQPVYSGFPALLMSPQRFLQDPAAWLEAISRHAVTHTGGPNFAYDLCSRRVEPDATRLDLSSWEVAYNGAEPVRAETLERFAARFAPCGFNRRSFYPAYGLAEATLKVSGGARGEGATIVRLRRDALAAGRAEADAAGVPLVGAGRAADGTRVVVVDPDRIRPRADGEVGEIWVAGPGVAMGYWSRVDETERTFRARLPAETARFLRTGDLGFSRGGEIFVTGRLKDLIIIRGRNLYPQDVERTVESAAPGLRAGACAAFGVEREGEERLVVVQEIDRHAAGGHSGAIGAIRAAIVEAHEVDPDAILLVAAGTVPKTTSGKIQRAACRAAYVAGKLSPVASWRAPDPGAEAAPEPIPGDARAWITSRLAAKLGLAAASIDLTLPAARLGLDSLRSLELVHEIHARYGVDLSAADLIALPSLESLLARVESGARGRSIAPPSYPEPPDECPLTHGQAAIAFLHELAPAAGAYTIASALRLEGPLDERALGRAVRALVSRHASLRARILLSDGPPRQRFDVAVDAIYATRDLRGGDVPGPSALADEAGRPFDLGTGPLVRITLLKEKDAATLLIAAHHTVADLWSLSVVLQDLRALYAAEIGSGAAPAATPPHPAELVAWQERFLAGGAGGAGAAGGRQRAAARARLGGEIPPLELPADRARPAAPTFRGGAITRRLDAALAAALRELARSRGVTLFTFLLSAYEAWLHRVTGQRDILVGTPASGRSLARFAGLVAYMVNPVVLRADLRGDPTFEDLVRATHLDVLRALSSQDYPFASLVRELAPERDARRSPFFDTMFDLHATGEMVRGDLGASGEARFEFAPGVTARPLGVERRSAQFDLSVTVTDEGKSLAIEMEYASDLFEAATVDAFLARFVTLLSAIAGDPGARLSRLPLLSRRERGEALRDANAIPARLSAEPIHRLFERQAAARPGAVAIHDAGATTYRELNARANRLARRLREAGVGPEIRAAICLPKSADLLVALLGVLKAGGAYVPIEPSLPAARRRFMIEDSRARVVVACPDLEIDLPAGVTRIDPGVSSDGAHGADNPDFPVDAGGLAYLIYTSGTTGVPKGVGVTHANLHSAFHAWRRAYGLRPGMPHLQMAAPGFDVFSGDVVRALASGGSLVLCDRDTLLDPPALADLIRRHGVEFAEFVPATLRELAAHVVRTNERLDPLRLVAVGSDVWSMADHALFRRAFDPAARLVNSYGVTEATIDSTLDDTLDSAGAAAPRRAAPSIGRPLANTSAYVLDTGLEPTASGVRGELYLGGPAVSRGYVGRPDLTADRFVPDPHGEPGARMYRTGDQAVRLADGRLEFLGRADTQVKIRGFRVETAEVEAALAAHAGVKSCAVIPRDEGAARRLVAYVVLGGRDGVSVASLRAHVAERLPDFMVPSAFVVLDAMPLSPNGKVDRRSLPEPSWEPVSAPAGERALTESEERMAAIWRRVLRVERVGPHDDFFRLGGDSILTIQIVARAREEGIAITARMIFDHPTVASLAAAAGARRVVAGAPAASPDAADAADAGGRAGTSTLLPMQRWFFAQGFARPSHWNMTVALEARGDLETGAALRAARALVDHHEALRSRFVREGPEWKQVIDAPGSRAAEVAEEGSPSTLARRLNESLDIEAGPVIRFGVARESNGKAALIVAAHHLVVDGVSLRVLIDDFERAYGQAVKGNPISLPARTASGGAYAEALAETVRARRSGGDRSDAARPPAPPPDGLPLRGADAEATEATTIAATTRLDAPATLALIEAAAGSGERVEDLLLAAVASALCEATGTASLAVEIEGHGRDLVPDLDLSRTVGWFTSTRAVVLAPVDVTDPGATLAAVRRAARDAITVDPAPRISFNYLGRFDVAVGPRSLFTSVGEPAAPPRSLRSRRTHAIEIDASVEGGCLRVQWAHSNRQIDHAFVAAIAQRCRHFLDRIVALAADPEIEERLPLTPMQEGMLFHHLRDGARDPYVGQIALELDGTINLDALARAWQLAADAHGALRTEFDWKGTSPAQVVRRRVTLPVAIHDERVTPLPELMARARAGGFDVKRAPLARVDLVRSAKGAVAVFTHHHLLLDGWSLPIVLESVFAAYESGGAARPALRRESDSRRAHARCVETRDADAARSFFTSYLQGFAEPTPAPDPGGIGPAAAGSEAGGPEGSGVVHVEGPPGVAGRARALGLTPNTVVQAAWALTLAAAAGRRDVVFGATSSGRPPEIDGIETAVGLFINTLPVRATIDPAARALDWMRSLQMEGARIRQHEGTPLAEIQRFSPVKSPAHLFETLLVFENYPVDVRALGRRAGFTVSNVRLHEETNYPLTIVASYEEGLSFRAIFRHPRYDEATARAVVERLSVAMEDLLARPDARLEEIATMAAAERRLVLETWNATRREYPRGATIAEIFEQVARERADETALVYEGGSWTYSDLDRRSAGIARALRARGVAAESLVAVAMERSPDLIAAVLGILRAGGAYMPIDPDSPPERTARMIEGASVRLVVTGGTVPAPVAGVYSVTYETLAREAAGAPRLRPESAGRAECLAYVIFTSGSTGEPKGIEVTNRNVLRLVLGTEYVRFGPGETILQVAPVAFDASTFEIWGALLTGGRLAIAPPGPLSASAIADLLRRFDVTTLWLTAGLFHVVVDEEVDALARVRQVIAGGDVLSPAHVGRLLDAGCPRVVNGYGPTETTTFACCATLSKSDAAGARVPIGAPIANARACVVDDRGGPAPIGAPGELWIGGDGVARGYTGRPDLTAERFVPDPHGAPGSRVYRTGDIARRRADGRLDFLGRRDGQIKVRGFRVEIAEIESALAALPEIAAAAVGATRDGAGAELVAWVVPRRPGGGDAAALRAALAVRIPRYMIPSRFVFLDALPLTANGKIDRGALPAAPAATSTPAARAMDPIETAVADLWKTTLGLDRVGPDDDFFEVGGHSLHATRLLAAIRRAFRIDLPMAALFEATTIAALARALVAHQPQPGHVEKAARALARLRAVRDGEGPVSAS